MAYYAVFSLAPLVIISIAIAGFVFGQDSARHEIVFQVGSLIGPRGAEAVQSILENASQDNTSAIASIVGIVTLLYGATGVFTQLQEAFDQIWGVAPKPERGLVRGFIEDRILSFTLVVGIGFLLLVSLIVSALLSGLSRYIGGFITEQETALRVGEIVISFFVFMMLFALTYKVVPRVKVAWRDVWLGGAISSFLLSLSKFLIGLYLGNSSIATTYGAAGSLVVVLLWVYISAQILFFGAEFTQVYARRHGSQIRPSAGAVIVDDKSFDRKAFEIVESVKEDISPEEVKAEAEKGAQPKTNDNPEKAPEDVQIT